MPETPMTETPMPKAPMTAAPNETPKIEMRDVRKSFGPKHVLRGINLTVPASESLVIIGGSGTGKSVLLKCILGLIVPDSGQIIVDGENVATKRGKAREQLLDKFGMLFQGGALFDSLLVWENVAFRLLHGTGKLPREEARAIAIQKLRRVGLKEDSADLFPAELSGGMQKRVGLARAIAAEPEIIFFDEPTTGLDPIMAGVINDLIRETSVRKIADQVAMIHEGVIQWVGPVGEIDGTDNAYIHQFVNGLAEGPIEAIR